MQTYFCGQSYGHSMIINYHARKMPLLPIVSLLHLRCYRIFPGDR